MFSNWFSWTKAQEASPSVVIEELQTIIQSLKEKNEILKNKIQTEVELIEGNGLTHRKASEQTLKGREALKKAFETQLQLNETNIPVLEAQMRELEALRDLNRATDYLNEGQISIDDKESADQSISLSKILFITSVLIIASVVVYKVKTK